MPEPGPKKVLWISAGELSGDMQGGALLTALRPLAQDWSFVGLGGDHLARAGQKNIYRIEELSVMGVAEVLASLPRIIRLLFGVLGSLRKIRPTAILLIDAPAFNFLVARFAAYLQIPVFYFIPPKVWASRTGRVKFLRKHVRKILSILPFETAFFQKHGLDAIYVGNPLVDLVNWPELAYIEPEPLRIGLMPGSRKKEIESLLPVFSAMADLLLTRHPGLTFRLMRAPNFSEDYLRKYWTSAAPLVIQPPQDRYAFMRTCRLIVAASGTATLETGLAGVPTVVCYKVNPISYPIMRRVIKVSWISLPNLILGRELFPEYIQENATPELLAGCVSSWLENPALLGKILDGLTELRRQCGEPGSANPAAALYEEMKNLKL